MDIENIPVDSKALKIDQNEKAIMDLNFWFVYYLSHNKRPSAIRRGLVQQFRFLLRGPDPIMFWATLAYSQWQYGVLEKYTLNKFASFLFKFKELDLGSLSKREARALRPGRKILLFIRADFHN